MVNVSAYTWTEFITTTATPLYGVHLNRNFDYVSDLVNKGITGANIATSGVDSPALIANAMITDGHLDTGTGDGVRICRPFGSVATQTAGYKVAVGYTTMASTTATYSTMNVYYSQCLCYTTADTASFNGPPYFSVVGIYSTTGTGTCRVFVMGVNYTYANIRADYGTAATEFATPLPIRWVAIGGYGV